MTSSSGNPWPMEEDVADDPRENVQDWEVELEVARTEGYEAAESNRDDQLGYRIVSALVLAAVLIILGLGAGVAWRGFCWVSGAC